MDHALHLAAVIHAYRDHVPPVPHGDDRVLQRPRPGFGLNEPLKPVSRALPHGLLIRANPAQRGTGVIANVAVGVDRLSDRRFDLLEISQAGRQGPDMGLGGTTPQPQAECPHEAAYPEGVRHVQQDLRIQHGATRAGLFQGLANVLDAPQGNGFPLVEESPHLGDGLEVLTDYADLVCRIQGHRPAMTLYGDRPFRYHRPDGVEFQDLQRVGRYSGFHVRSLVNRHRPKLTASDR